MPVHFRHFHSCPHAIARLGGFFCGNISAGIYFQSVSAKHLSARQNIWINFGAAKSFARCAFFTQLIECIGFYNL
ncbi:hypothetical protein C7S13_8390 [Burkholderia cepacia]|nr:hypothetical protein [Burkholderia cepacia]